MEQAEERSLVPDTYLLHSGALVATCFIFVSWLTYSFTLKMEATCPFKTSVEFQWTPWCYIPEDRTHINRCENLRPSINNSLILLIMWETWPLATLWNFTSCNRDVFTFFTFNMHQSLPPFPRGVTNADTFRFHANSPHPPKKLRLSTEISSREECWIKCFTTFLYLDDYCNRIFSSFKNK
jgi:hypothetical protein